MESIRKIFTGLDFGGRRIKGAKIDGQPYYVPFNFNDANKTNPVPQEVIKTIASMFSSPIGTNELPIFYLYLGDVPIPQASVLMQCDVEDDVVNTIMFLSLADGVDTTNLSIVKSAKQLMINGVDGSWELEELPFNSGGAANSIFKIIDTDDIRYDQIDESWMNYVYIISYRGSYQKYIGRMKSYPGNLYSIIAYSMNFIDDDSININYLNIGISPEGTQVDKGTYTNQKEICLIDINNYTVDQFTQIKSDIQSGKPIFIEQNNMAIQVFPYHILDSTINLMAPMTSEYKESAYTSDGISIGYLIFEITDNDASPWSMYDPIIVNLKTIGDGTKFLSDDGSYKELNLDDSAGVYDIQLSDFTSAEDFTNLLAARQEGKIIRINGIIVDYVTVGDNVIIFQSPATLDITRNANIVKYSVRVSTYRFNPDGTYSQTFAQTPINGDGTKFLSDDGTYKEVKTSDLTNVKVTQEEYNALEAAGTLDANTIYYIIG